MCVCSVVSDYLQLYRLQPTGLLCPWDSPGKLYKKFTPKFGGLRQCTVIKSELLEEWFIWAVLAQLPLSAAVRTWQELQAFEGLAEDGRSFPRCVTHMAVYRGSQFPTDFWQEVIIPSMQTSSHSMQVTGSRLSNLRANQSTGGHSAFYDQVSNHRPSLLLYPIQQNQVTQCREGKLGSTS